MPAKGFRKAEPVDCRLKVGLTATQYARLADKATAAGLSTAHYVRALIEHDLGDRAGKPTVSRQHDTMLLLAEVHLLAMQIKKLGTNVNQMAHQVNSGMVPLTAAELNVAMRQIAVAMDMAGGLFEKVLNR